ncbi:hypothetical protein BJ165DRAFT_1523071 [Panaeolus papilionaceus]|nr:hypothetical protein BJ165DRAFT_1523071 [Panaeolus papilionaceus]
MPVASRSSRLSYVSVKQPAPTHGPDHQVLSSQPSSPLHGGPNATFTSFNSEGHSRRYHEVKLTGDLSRVSWVWGAPTSLARLSQDKEDSIRIEVISEADAVGEGKMLNPYSEFAPKNNNIVEPELNDGDVANSIRSWTISEEDEASDHEGDSPASFTARFPHTESPRPPESIQDIHNEYQHPNYSHTQFQDRASIASGSTNTLSYVSDDDQPKSIPVSTTFNNQSPLSHSPYHGVAKKEEKKEKKGTITTNVIIQSSILETPESYDNGAYGQPHAPHDPWGQMPHSGVEGDRTSFQEHGAVYPNFGEAGPSKLPPIAHPGFSSSNGDHPYEQHHLPPLSTGEPFIPQRLSRASSISVRSGYGKYREPVLPHTSAPGVRVSQPITPANPITPNVPVTPPSAIKPRRFGFPLKFRDRSTKTKTKEQTKELPKLPASSSRLMKKQNPSMKSRTTLIPQEQEKVDLREVDDGSSWVVLSH